jgi:lipopolysaccharide transport system permease protein
VFLLTTSVVAMSSSLAVRYRDMLSALPFILQLGLFVAPVGYGLTHLSPVVRAVVEINPVTGLIEAARWIVIAGFRPSVTAIIVSLALTGVLAVVGWLVFTRAETTMADVI